MIKVAIISNSIVYLLGAFLSWDFTWISHVGEWEPIERWLFLMGLIVTTIIVSGANQIKTRGKL